MGGRAEDDRSDAVQLARELSGRCLGIRVSRLHRIVSRAYEQALRPVGLTLAQVEILTALTTTGAPVRPSELAEQLAVERSTMSRNLAILQERALVTAVDTSPTGRTLTVAITAAGTSVLARARDFWVEAQDAMVAQLGPDAVETLDGWLSTLAVH